MRRTLESVVLPFVCRARIHLPASLHSTPVTALHRYYGGSDSCTPLPDVQVSLLHVLTLPDHSVPNHLVFPCRRFILATLFSARQVSHLKTLCLSIDSGHRQNGSRLRHSLAGSPKPPGRNGFVILRTGRSPPAALHPASRRRSYSRLQAVAYTWRGLAPLCVSTPAGALGQAFEPAVIEGRFWQAGIPRRTRDCPT